MRLTHSESVRRRSAAWWQQPLPATIAQVAWAYYVWYFVIIAIGWEQYGIGIGLMGAFYPVFFSVPVALLAWRYLSLVRGWLIARDASQTLWLLLFWLCPMAVNATGLLLFCPAEQGVPTFIVELWQHVMRRAG